MTTDYDVVIAGAGPVGLWLAGELQLAGVRTAVLERLETPNPNPKALGLQPRTLEVFAMRGLDTPYPFVLALPQVRTEALLEERANGLGARILRGREVTGLTEDEASVTVELADGGTLSGRYLVGADGSGSTVRRAAGIDFVGSDSTVFGFLGDVVLDDPPPMGATFYNEYGAVLTAPIPGGLVRVSGYDATDQVPGRREVTCEELRATAIRIAGTDFGMRDPRWLSRFGNATRHAETYRADVAEHTLAQTALIAGHPSMPPAVTAPELGDATAAVVRPDGYVWWATDSANPDEEIKAAPAELGTTF